MFSFLRTAKVKRFLFVGFILAAMATMLAGCNDDPEDTDIEGSLPDELVGKWVSNYGDWFEIARSSGTETVKYDGDGWGDYAGTIRFVSNFDSKSGVIIIEYTAGVPDSAKKFHAIYYLNLISGTSVELNNTSDATADDWNADTATLEEAKTKFTADSMGNWMNFDHSTAYNKE